MKNIIIKKDITKVSTKFFNYLNKINKYVCCTNNITINIFLLTHYY